jgi:hypothetical protein
MFDFDLWMMSWVDRGFTWMSEARDIILSMIKVYLPKEWESLQFNQNLSEFKVVDYTDY